MILNGRPPDRAAHARDFLPSRGKFTASVLVVFRHLTTDDDKSHCRRRIIELASSSAAISSARDINRTWWKNRPCWWDMT